jgi:hypothetical protein
MAVRCAAAIASNENRAILCVRVCVCVCKRARACACVHVVCCVYVCVGTWGGGVSLNLTICNSVHWKFNLSHDKTVFVCVCGSVCW